MQSIKDMGFELAVRRAFVVNPALVQGVENGVLDRLIATGVDYGSVDAATEAAKITLSVLSQTKGYELRSVDTDPIGDFTLAAVGTYSVENQTFDGEPAPGYHRTFDLAILWVVTGSLVVSYEGTANDSQPMADVVMLRETSRADTHRVPDRLSVAPVPIRLNEFQPIFNQSPLPNSRKGNRAERSGSSKSLGSRT